MKTNNFIFDLDGTLWNTSEISAAAYNDVIQKDGRSSLHVTAERIRAEFGKPIGKIGESLFPELAPEDQKELIEACSRNNDIFVANDQTDVLYPGVKDTLIRLSRSCNIYIVSNCLSGYVELFMEKYGLDKYIRDFGHLGRTENSKDKNILAIMKRNGIKEAMYVGDTMGDYEAAMLAGVPFIFASYGYGDVSMAKYRVSSFSELLGFVK